MRVQGPGCQCSLRKDQTAALNNHGGRPRICCHQAQQAYLAQPLTFKTSAQLRRNLQSASAHEIAYLSH